MSYAEPVNIPELIAAWRERRQLTKLALWAVQMPFSPATDPPQFRRILAECCRCGRFAPLASLPAPLPGEPRAWYCRECLAGDLDELRRELARLLRRREGRP